jgi:hypothetical protein
MLRAVNDGWNVNIPSTQSKWQHRNENGSLIRLLGNRRGRHSIREYDSHMAASLCDGLRPAQLA